MVKQVQQELTELTVQQEQTELTERQEQTEQPELEPQEQELGVARSFGLVIDPLPG